MPTTLPDSENRARQLEGAFAAVRVLREAAIPPDSPRARSLFPELMTMPDQDAMRRHVAASGVAGLARAGVPLREAAAPAPTGEAPTGEARRRYTPAARALGAKEGWARPDGSWPIREAADVSQAVFDYGGSNGNPEIRAWIIKRAQAVPGGTDALPADWSTSLQESVKLQELGIPTLDGDPVRPTPLREASAAKLAERGVPILDDSAPASQQAPAQALADAGIPMLSTPPAGRLVKLTESTTGRVLARIA